jgi:transposase
VLVRREQLVGMLVAEKNRLHEAHQRRIIKSIEVVIRVLERQIDDTEGALAQALEQSEMWRTQNELLQSTPGIGPERTGAHIQAARAGPQLDRAIRCNPVISLLHMPDRPQQADKVAIVACVRKLLTVLNGMVKHHQPWAPKFT